MTPIGVAGGGVKRANRQPLRSKKLRTRMHVPAPRLGSQDTGRSRAQRSATRRKRKRGTQRLFCPFADQIFATSLSQSDVGHDVVVQKGDRHREGVEQRRRHRADAPGRLHAYLPKRNQPKFCGYGNGRATKHGTHTRPTRKEKGLDGGVSGRRTCCGLAWSAFGTCGPQTDSESVDMVDQAGFSLRACESESRCLLRPGAFDNTPLFLDFHVGDNVREETAQVDRLATTKKRTRKRPALSTAVIS